MGTVHIHNDCDAPFSTEAIENAIGLLIDCVEDYFHQCTCGEDTLDAAYLKVTQAYKQLGRCIQEAEITFS